MKESNLAKTDLPKWQKKNGPCSHLFRNNTGTGYQGEVIKDDGKTIILANYRIVKFGIGLWRRLTKKSPYRAVGGGDYIGWTCKQVTPDMVGNTVAIFTSREYKTKNVRETKDQKDFREMVNNAGGIAEVIRE